MARHRPFSPPVCRGSSRALLPSDLTRAACTIGELVDAAAVNPDRWSRVVRELHRVSGAKAVIQAHDPSFGRPLVAVAAGWSQGYFEPYAKYFAFVNDV